MVVVSVSKRVKKPKPPKPGKAYVLPAAGGAFNLWVARVTDATQPPTEPQGRTILASPGTYRAKIALGNWDDVVP